MEEVGPLWCCPIGKPSIRPCEKRCGGTPAHLFDWRRSGYYQGAFKGHEGIVEEFGPQRVVDTPITEAGFTRLAIGAAMAGLHPIVELMTMNFRHCGSNRESTRLKIRYMSGGQLSVPLVIRGPGSAAHQLGAQRLRRAWEAWFAMCRG